MTEKSTLFKDIFFKEFFFSDLTSAIKTVYPTFKTKAFLKAVVNDEWQHKELKQKTAHLANTLKSYLPDNFPDAVQILMDTIVLLKNNKNTQGSFGYIAIAEYIEKFGLTHYKESVKAMEVITTFISCEFAVRPFIIRYEDRMMKQMIKWSKHTDAKVRRLSSEGCRPRLPWGIALKSFKKDPAPIMPILENLKSDEDVWVRKSVANNLNDISKDNPELAIDVFEEWIGDNEYTDWVVKHAARTLLKAGNKEVMSLFGLNDVDHIKVEDFKIGTGKVKNGEDLHFSFSLFNEGAEPTVVRIEYGMYYLRANGKHSKKVFKISERSYDPGKKYDIVRKQSFRPITTRVYYPGLHKVSIILNGEECKVEEFELTE